MSERILVTGGLGFVGAPLCAHLVRAGHAVSVFDDLSRGRPDDLAEDVRDAVRVIEGDVRDPAAVAAAVDGVDPTRVYHLAALHFIPACEASPHEAVAINVVGTQVVFDACARANSVECVMIASSAAVYGPSASPHREAEQPAPIDVYGQTKLWSEQIAELFHARTGIPVGIARLFNVFGPSETNPHLIPVVLAQAIHGGPLQLGNLDTCRDYVFVEDVAEAFSRLPGAAVQSGIITLNVGTGVSTSGHDVVKGVGRLLGRELSIETDSSRLRASDRPFLVADTRGLRDAVGWKPLTMVAEGLRAALSRPASAALQLDDQVAAEQKSGRA